MTGKFIPFSYISERQRRGDIEVRAEPALIPNFEIIKKGIRFPGFLILNRKNAVIRDKNTFVLKHLFIPFFDI